MSNTIPKIIHYCWFGKNEIPAKEKIYIEKWKKVLEHYEFILWNEDNFDVDSVEWTKQAYANKKYAFVADYVRLYALKKYGGIYLDTDIDIVKSFDDLLNQSAFIGFEDGVCLSAGVIACQKNNPTICELETAYAAFQYDAENEKANVKYITEVFKKKGLKTDNTEQFVAEFHVYPKTFFNPMDYFGNWDKSRNTYCIHQYMGSWLSEQEKNKLNKRRKFAYRTRKRAIGIVKTALKKMHYYKR